MIDCKCKKCGKELRLPVQLSGRNVECPVCKKTISVPVQNVAQMSTRPDGGGVAPIEDHIVGKIVGLVFASVVLLAIFIWASNNKSANPVLAAFLITLVKFVVGGAILGAIGTVFSRRQASTPHTPATTQRRPVPTHGEPASPQEQEIMDVLGIADAPKASASRKGQHLDRPTTKRSEEADLPSGGGSV